MKPIPKTHSWETRLGEMKAQLATLSGAEYDDLSRKIVALEKAIAIRDSLSTKQTPAGSVEFSL